MPTYEYRCPAGHTFEKIQKITEKTRAKCPTCGKMASRQISGGAGLVFKGTGFYITDYGKGGQGPRKPETGAEGSEAKSEKDTSAKPESPPAKAEKPAKKAKE
jgi:putative FmdB family regulatory protein